VACKTVRLFDTGDLKAVLRLPGSRKSRYSSPISTWSGPEFVEGFRTCSLGYSLAYEGEFLENFANTNLPLKGRTSLLFMETNGIRPATMAPPASSFQDEEDGQ
jgi:hypothetical protein